MFNMVTISKHLIRARSLSNGRLGATAIGEFNILSKIAKLTMKLVFPTDKLPKNWVPSILKYS